MQTGDGAMVGVEPREGGIGVTSIEPVLDADAMVVVDPVAANPDESLVCPP